MSVPLVMKEVASLKTFAFKELYVEVRSIEISLLGKIFSTLFMSLVCEKDPEPEYFLHGGHTNSFYCFTSPQIAIIRSSLSSLTLLTVVAVL